MTDLASAIKRRRHVSDVLLVGIDGRGGSGKSTLARALQKFIFDSTVIAFDDFYRPLAAHESSEPAEVGTAFDWKRLRDQVLEPLSRNEAARYQRHEWDTDSMGEWHTVLARGVVLVEGSFSTREELRAFYHFRIWMHAPRDVRLARGVERDGEAARERWLEEWMPEEERYIASQQPWRFAHVLIDGAPHKGVDPNCTYAQIE